MNIVELQVAIGARADGIWGPKSRDAMLAAFTNRRASRITEAELRIFARRMNCTVKQIRAVAAVESAGGGYDRKGRPKILFERHKFWKYTGGKWPLASFNNPVGGGYNEDSWEKLLGAIVTGDVDAAFMACSWGRFQVLGEWWDDFGFSSPFAMAFSTVPAESAHFRLLSDYVIHNHLTDELAAISANPETCRAFARGYNGPDYAQSGYHTRLSRAMK